MGAERDLSILVYSCFRNRDMWKYFFELDLLSDILKEE